MKSGLIYLLVFTKVKVIIAYKALKIRFWIIGLCDHLMILQFFNAASILSILWNSFGVCIRLMCSIVWLAGLDIVNPTMLAELPNSECEIREPGQESKM